MKAKEYELIICICNHGYSDVVMDAAKKAGARGGTVIQGRGTANPEAAKIFNIVVEPEKDMVMTVVTKDIRDAILHAIYEDAGSATPAQGVAFSLPVDKTVGLGVAQEEEKEEA